MSPSSQALLSAVLIVPAFLLAYMRDRSPWAVAATWIMVWNTILDLVLVIAVAVLGRTPTRRIGAAITAFIAAVIDTGDLAIFVFSSSYGYSSVMWLHPR